jgi:phage terminase large subunit
MTDTTRILRETAAAKTRVVVNMGGARSSKSHSVAQLLIHRALEEPGLRVGITRKTMESQHNSTIQLLMSLLGKYCLYEPALHDKTHNRYRLGDSVFVFFGMDDLDRIKSTEFNVIWMEEADEFDWDDYVLLCTRLSAQGLDNKMYLTLNPSDAEGWIAAKLLSRPDITLVRSNYRDNPFLPPDYSKSLEELRGQDEAAWRVYARGEWGQKGSRIYTDIRLTDALPDNPEDVFYGLDFGYNNPTALVLCAMKDGTVYAEELLYEVRLTNAALIVRLKKLLPQEMRARPLYADSAEPARIAELNCAGFNALPADKALLDGIGSVQSLRPLITRASKHLLQEMREYKWRKNRDGANSDEPVKQKDHALDALRYAVRTHLKPLPPKAEFRSEIIG